MGLLKKPVKQLLLPFWNVVGIWATPAHLFQVLDEEFNFTLDACATGENHLCRAYFTPEQDALTRPWTGVVWCNPPYGRGLERWVEKAYRESQRGWASTIVMLLPAATDTRWFHQYAPLGEVRFIAGRLRFGSAPHSAPFPSLLLIFRTPRRLDVTNHEDGPRGAWIQ